MDCFFLTLHLLTYSTCVVTYISGNTFGSHGDHGDHGQHANEPEDVYNNTDYMDGNREYILDNNNATLTPESSGNTSSSISSISSISSSISSSRGLTKSEIKAFYNRLFDKKIYDKRIRPVMYSNESIDVYVRIELRSLIGIQEKDQTMATVCRFEMTWNDTFLASQEPYDIQVNQVRAVLACIGPRLYASCSPPT